MAYPGYQPSKSSSPFASGQTGARRGSVTRADIGRDLDREMTRKTYFNNRPDVSFDRLDRRQKQAQEYDAFKDTLKLAGGTTNLYQASDPVFNPQTGRYERTTLADKAMQLANKYGPTPREIMGDIAYGTGQMMSGLAKLPGQAIEAYKQFSPVGRILQGAQNFFKPVGQNMKQLGNNIQGGISSFFDLFKGQSQFTPAQVPQAPGSIPDSRERSMANLTPLQQVVYDRVINLPGKTHGDALAAAMRQNYPTNYTPTTVQPSTVNVPSEADLNYMIGQRLYADFLRRNQPRAFANGGIATFN